MRDLLDNVFWHALTGPLSRFALGKGSVRRFAPGFSRIVAFADQSAPDLELLATFCKPGEAFYSDGWSGPVGHGWNLEEESTMVKMVWEGVAHVGPEPEIVVSLGPEHAESAVELAELTHPGPFGPRTLEFGDYLGAMAGERTEAGPFREISGVCTHPDFQGRGYARLLMEVLIQRQVRKGQTPFLHVMSANELARSFYGRMGFVEYLESVVRVVSTGVQIDGIST